MDSKDNGEIEIHSGENNPPRLVGSHVRVLDIARYHERWKMTPEQIVEELGVVSLADVYAALALYHSHKENMDALMESEAKLAFELREERSKPLRELLAELDSKVVRYHLDRSCPKTLAEALRDKGIDVTTTPEVWLRKASDEEQLSYAVSSRRIVLTHDIDFLGLKRECDREHRGIFYLHPTHDVSEMVKTLTQIHEHLDATQFINRVEFL